MNEVRERITGDLTTSQQVKKDHKHVSWAHDSLEVLGYDVVVVVNPALPSDPLKMVIRDGVENFNGEWLQRWIEVDRHEEPDKAQKEADYLVSLKDQEKERVVQLMIQHQDGGTMINGVAEMTDNVTISSLQMVKTKGNASKKVVNRNGKGKAVRQDNKQATDAFFDDIAVFRQSVEDHAFDLIAEIEADLNPDIEAGWPV